MTQAKHPADPTPPTLEGKLALLQKLRDELGSGDTIRRLFFGDLEPIALQPRGANTVVHLYNKANDVTIAYSRIGSTRFEDWLNHSISEQ